MAQRVLIVDDHLAFAEAMALAVDAQSDLECVGTATNRRRSARPR